MHEHLVCYKSAGIDHFVQGWKCDICILSHLSLRIRQKISSRCNTVRMCMGVHMTLGILVFGCERMSIILG